MLISKFSCTECGAILKPANPQPEGKRIKCPKCGKTFAVAAMDEEIQAKPAKASAGKSRAADDDEDVDLDSRPSRRRRPAEDDDEDSRPTRRGRGRDDDEDDESERPAKKRFKKKKSAAGGKGLRIILLVAVLVLVVGSLSAGIYYAWPYLVPGDAKTQVDRCYNDASDILATVKDKPSAEAAKPKLVKVGERLRAIRLEGEKQLEKLRGQPLPEVDLKNVKMMTKEEEEAYFRAERRFEKEGQRVVRVPGGKELLQAFFDTWGTAMPFYDVPDVFPEGPGRGPFNPFQNPDAGPPSKVTRENFALIQVGMTENQVTDILGPPSFVFPEFGQSKQRVLQFSSSRLTGSVTFENGRVVNKNP